jgi:hypothetical protein
VTGIEERETESGIHVFRVSFTADPMKRSDEWQKEAAAGMLGGINGRAWRSEMLIDWSVGSGLGVYADIFDREDHVAPHEIEWIPQLPIYRGWDTGPTHISPACVIAQLDSLGRLAALKEVVSWNGRGEPKATFLDEFAEVVTVECNRCYPAGEWHDVMDPAAWTKQTVTSEERSAVEILNRHGIYPSKGAVTFTARKAAMYDRLEQRRRGVLLDPRCRMLIEGFSGKYQYEHIGGMESGQHRATVDKNAWSHPMDAFSYCVSFLYAPARYAQQEDPDAWRDRRKRKTRRSSVTGY